ncbi:MAG: protein-export chaperone SecB [Bacilli bacterium]|nr:protein-export chaperone SecB [Bacilli bacterium]
MSGSIESGIQFIRYKIDTMNFETEKTLGILNLADASNYHAQFKFALSNPIRYTVPNEVLYVVSFATDMELVNNDNPEEKIAKGRFCISGLFKGVGTSESKIEDKLIKIQAPAILFPYLRASVTSVLLNAGFSQIQMPLINVNELASNFELTIEDR